MSDSKRDPEALALRAPPRPITRLNRRLLIIAVSGLAGVVLGVTLWSLRRDVRLQVTRTELHNVERIAQAEGLDRLPPDYSKLPVPKAVNEAAPPVPLLGEPLPGDLGGPMLRAERASGATAVAGSAATSAPADATSEALRAERLSQQREIEEAAKAPLFFRGSAPTAATNKGQPPASPSTVLASESAASRRGGASSAVSTPTTQANTPALDDKRSFLAARSDESFVSGHALRQPLSPYAVMAGTIISAALLTAINSDLPGTILATVTEPVYDSKLGQYLLIPQGTRLIGEYASKVAFGERRVLLVWNRMVFPDGSSLTLDRLPGVDAQGNAGLVDGVDRHWGQLLAGAALSSLIGVAAELAAPDRSVGHDQVIVSTRQSVEDSINQVGQELTRRNLNVQPTLTARAGFPLRVIVSKDLVLQPYRTALER